MADMVVTSVVSKLGELVATEANMLMNVDRDIRELRDKLEWLQAFIKDADHKRRGKSNEFVVVWVRQTRDVAFEVEDALDEFFLKIDLARYHGWMNSVGNFFTKIAMQIAVRHDLSRRILKINERLDQINKNKEAFQITSAPSERYTASSSSATLAVVPWYKEESVFIGFEDELNILKKRLLNIDPVTKRRAVVSIVGESGIGKSTLATKICECPEIKRHFEVRAWTFLHPNFHVSDNLEDIYNQVAAQVSDFETNSDDEECSTEKRVMSCLKGRRYLVVIDGLDSISDWNSICDALFDDGNGSRILLVTRLEDKEILHADPEIPPLKLKRLDAHDTEELFRRRVFGESSDCPSNFNQTIYNDIFDISQGLPLAVAVLAGLLRSMEFPGEWEAALAQLKCKEQVKRIKRVWSTSFDELEHHRKSCFLYFAAMQENMVLDAHRLVRLWIAEGFVNAKKGHTMEEVGMSYLKDLISRGLVHLVEMDAFGCIASIAIHSRLHAFTQAEAQEANFLEVHDSSDVHAAPTVRRLALHNHADSFLNLSSSFPKLRSLLCDFAEDLVKNSHLEDSWLQSDKHKKKRLLWQSQGLRFVQQSKFLRVIDLHGIRIRRVPSQIGDMIHLRYLGLRQCDVEELPSSMRKLINLQTLDIRENKVTKVVEAFWKIETLRHVLAKKLFLSTGSIGAPLINLQTLSGIVCPDPRSLNEMIHLRSLHLEGLSSSHMKTLSDVLRKLQFLVDLELVGDCLPSDLFTNTSLRRLQALALHGHLVEATGRRETGFGDDRCMLPNLAKLTMHSSAISQVFIDKLADLPSLAELNLLNASYSGVSLVFGKDGFPSLAKLRLHHLEELEEWIIEEKAMPQLASLTLAGCFKLKVIHGLQDSKDLNEVVLHDMPAIVAMIQAQDKALYGKTKHLVTSIPEIFTVVSKNWKLA